MAVSSEETTVASLEKRNGDKRYRLSEAEMLKFEEWNSSVPGQVDQCLHTLIMEWCQTQKDAPAICAWDGNLTYGDLNVLSSTLAVHLTECGIRAEMFVPLCFEKSRWTAVAILGVLKAGAAFVLLDPNQPLSRLQELCTSVAAALVLSSSANKSLCEQLSIHVVVPSNLLDAPSLYGPPTPTAVVRPHNAAYASFTSGSTGHPKVVVVEHSAICSNALAHNVKLNLHTESRVLQSASYAFGASILQMIMTWIAGGCVCVPCESDCRDNLAKAACHFRVNWAFFTPSFLRIVRPQDLPSLKHVFLGGEPPARNDIKAWGDNVQVGGAYGSAECSVLCAIAPDMRSLSSPQTIGQMTGCVGWVVEPDDHHQLVSPGMVGELLVEGPNLARGYLNDAKKTAEVFIEAPVWFSGYCERLNKTARRAGRMYKTGDLVRYNPDGSLTFVGRKDTQVQLHGQRVELGEVEHHIRGSLVGNDTPPVVAEVVTPYGSDHPLLVAFIAMRETTNKSSDPAQADLRRWVQGLGDWLAERLPRYMVPSAFVAVDTIPLTATGKTDRRRLREIGAALTPEQLVELLLPSREVVCVPATAIERQLLELWACVLNLPIDRISTSDSFLRIGGDSILAVQLVGAARDHGLSLTVTQIFNAPRLCDMASLVRADEHNEETIPPFSLLGPATDVDLARAQAASQCEVDLNRVEDVFPCTSLQEGMLAMTVKRPGDYIHQAVFEMSSDGDAASLERAWREVVTAIPMLRTRIVDLAGQGLVQVVIEELDAFAVASDLRIYLKEDKQEPMGLGTPLARFGVINSPESQRPVVVCTIHHSLFDGWSMSLILRQVEQAYHGRTRDRLVPFQGFVRHILQSTEDASEYWQQQLDQSEAVPFPSLPSPGYQPEADDVLQYHIPESQWPQSEITPSTAIRTAWAILLGQYTNAAEVVFGATVTGRQMPVPGVERMAGPTIATVPVRVRLEWEADTQNLLRQVQAQGLSMTLYEQMGLHQIRRISPDTERACQFQSLLVVQPPAQGARRDSEDTLFNLGTKTTYNGGDAAWRKTFNSYAMMVECYLEDNGTTVWISFDSQVLERVQIQRIARQLEHILRELCAQQGGPVPIKNICGPSKADRQQLEQWNRKLPEQVKCCVHHLISQRCKDQPDAPAVCAWDGNFTYVELDRLSSMLAAHLAKIGVGPEVFVPLCFEKSRWTTMAMLAVLKAGGAFVLLDPSHPRTWLQAICHMVSARVVIASVKQQKTAEELSANVVLVGSEENAWYETSQAEPAPVRPDNALYVVCTSGSTGVPKGTIIEHAGFCTSAFAYSRSSHMTSNSRVFQFASYAFDASIIENLTTLLIGGCICVPSDDARRDHVGAAASQLRATWAELTPSTARLLESKDLATVETLVFIGEPVTATDFRWHEQVNLINAYGPAECSAISSVQPNASIQDTRNIGHGTGCVHWVVSPQDPEKLLPIGAIGELVIEGPIVGRGYLSDPGKTAAVFIDPPGWLRDFRGGMPAINPTRVYLTGDLVQYAADGSLRFVGRKDTQVKLRGQRIELEEVEIHIRQQFPGVRDAVTEVIPLSGTERPVLVAFVWPDTTIKCHGHDMIAPPTDAFRAAISTAEARLHDIVPPYMVPTVFLPLTAVPLTITGKTDRRRLRNYAAALTWAEAQLYSHAASAKRMPMTAAEQTLQRLWAWVLNVLPDTIGADDSFFRIGGDSITAMQLSSVVRTEGFTLSVSDIFQYKTITRLAPFLTICQPSLVAEELVNVPFELSPIQRYFFEAMPSGADYFNQSFLIPLARRVAFHELARAIPIIVHHHPMLRARFSQHSDGTWCQSICDDSDASYRYHHSVIASLEEARPVLRTSQQSLDTRNGPLFSVDLIDISPGKQQYIYLVAHHLVIDLVSWRVLLGDLEDVLQNGHVSGTKTLAFQTWCKLQAEYAVHNLNPTKAFPSPLPPTALDYWGPAAGHNTWDNAIHDGFTVNERITATLFGKANNALKTQPVEIFQAALWHAFVQTFPDRAPPTIFNEGHGREPWDPAIDLSRTVGWFTTIWPMYIDGDFGDFVDVLHKVKDTRRRTPSNGWAYFTSRFLNPDGQQAFKTHGPAEIAFNYLGLYQQFEREGALFCPPTTLVEHVPDVAGDIPRFALIDVSVGVAQGCLHFSISYNRHMQHQDGIRRWIANCEHTLLDAAGQLASMGRRYTLCDFPLLSLGYKDLDVLVGKIQADYPSVEVEEVYPCSPIQHGILISQARDDRNYWTRFIWKVVRRGNSQAVDLGRLQKAWQLVINRHAILRTIFIDSVSESAYTGQVVLASAIAKVDVVKDTVGAPIAAIEDQFKITDGDRRPLHRLVLYATPTETACALDINHALIDAHSMRLLERDLRLAYDGKLSAGQGPPFRDYIAYLQRVPETAAKTYWEAYMQGVEPCLFPTICDRKINGEGRSQIVTSVDLGPAIQLHEFCQHHEVTLANLFQVAWGIVLRTYTGSRSICFGYLNSGRDVPVPAVQDTVGPFINLLVSRMELASNKTLLELAQENQKQYLESLPYQHCSLADVLHFAGMAGDELFNTVISIQRLGTGHQEETSVGLERVSGYDPTEYDIMVTISIENERITIHLSTWTTSLSDKQADRIVNALGQVALEIAERPYHTARQLSVFSEDDRKEIYTWNKHVPPRIDKLVHELIMERCRSQSDSPAVCAWDGDFTYGELDRVSSTLSLHLRKLGVGPGVIVPLYFEKSRWTTVAMLGVMKAGGAFVLLDPAHPPARLQSICLKVSAPVIVTSVLHISRAEQLAAQLAVRIVVVGDDTASWDSREGPLTDSIVNPADALYIVFTSGSTGNPKGVVITHTAFCSGSLRHGHSLGLTQESRVFQSVSYGFDVSISDSLTTLLLGACICVPSDTARMEDIAGGMTAYQASWAHLTPSVIRSVRPEEVPHLQTLALIGEPMSRADVATWATHVRLMNSYGPAECSVVSTVHSDIHSESEVQVIGRGVGCICWIIDPEDHEMLLPIGAVGELLIEGPIVGRGYLNDEVNTTAAFIEPPTWLRRFRGNDVTEGFLYKTGDLVQYTADGSLRFIGRKDTQVKIRGQRIELGEIEYHTRQCFPGAQAVVADVIAPTEAGRPPMLVAFVRVETKDDCNLDNVLLSPPTDAFRVGILAAEADLHEVVPAYMVPAGFLPLATLPLTVTGKTDRRRLHDAAAALSREEIESYGPTSAKRTPTTTAERTLQQLWGQVLVLPSDRIGADDSFFRLGGDSVTAMLLVGAVRRGGFALSITDVFRCPRLVDMSKRLRVAPRSGSRVQKGFV